MSRKVLCRQDYPASAEAVTQVVWIQEASCAVDERVIVWLRC